MKRIALIIPWVGRRPWYWKLWRKSAEGRPFDIIVIEKPLDHFNDLIREKLIPDYSLSSDYKLCDFKPMYGVMFEDLLKNYDCWAFGDCDILYGRKFNDWLERAVDYDIATVQSEFCAGPFTLVRNCEYCNTLFTKVDDWQSMMRRSEVVHFDELGEKWFRHFAFGGKTFEELRQMQPSFSSVCWREAETGNLRLLHETLIDERCLGCERAEIMSDGRLMVGKEELSLYHFVSSKVRFGFTGDENGVWISHGLPWFRDALRFGTRLATGGKTERMRCIAWLRRKVGDKTWYDAPVWNNW